MGGREKNKHDIKHSFSICMILKFGDKICKTFQYVKYEDAGNGTDVEGYKQRVIS